MLSLRELDVFRRVMELGTITAAAEALHISQPAVSRILQQAEKRVGFALFLRRNKRLLPTAEAHALFPETIAVFAALDTVQRRSDELQSGQGGVLRIAAISAFANALLPVAVERFRATRPEVSVTLQVMSALQVATALAHHQADLGFIIDSISVPGISIAPLCSTVFGCVMPRNHLLSGQASVTASDLERETLICLNRHLPLGALAMRVYADADVPLHAAIEVSQSTVACALVRAGAGLALLDGISLMGAPGDDLVLRPFNPAVDVIGRFIQPRHQVQSRLSREFIEVVQDLLAANDAPLVNPAMKPVPTSPLQKGA
jgi:DNA-binding transcriptional LysR family regulator